MLTAALNRVLGEGWRYRFPRHYHRIIERRFGRARQQAFDYFIERERDQVAHATTCLDLACGTGLTSLWLAARLPHLTVIGVDVNAAMLAEATRQAGKLGLTDRCLFKKGDAQQIDEDNLRRIAPETDGTCDIIVSALGFSVVSNPQKAFASTLRLLSHDGCYVIFDEFIPETSFPDFGADISRKSWELVERHFVTSETKWFGNSFIAFGHCRRLDDPDGQSRA